MSLPVQTALFTSAGTVTTDGTEQNLVNATAVAGTFALNLDLVNMTAADQVVIRAYKKANGSSTLRVHDSLTIRGGMSSVAVFGPWATSNDFKLTIQRISGTDRSYAWGVDNYSGS